MTYPHTCTKENVLYEVVPVWTDQDEVEYNCFCEIKTSHLINIVNFLSGNEDAEDLKAEMQEDLRKRRDS